MHLNDVSSDDGFTGLGFYLGDAYFLFFCTLNYITCLNLSGSGAVVGDDFPGRTVIGCNNIIGHHAVVGIKCQDLKYKVSFHWH